jgi:hypothetical protein
MHAAQRIGPRWGHILEHQTSPAVLCGGSDKANLNLEPGIEHPLFYEDLLFFFWVWNYLQFSRHSRFVPFFQQKTALSLLFKKTKLVPYSPSHQYIKPFIVLSLAFITLRRFRRPTSAKLGQAQRPCKEHELTLLRIHYTLLPPTMRCG